MRYKKCDAKPSNWPQWLVDADIDWCDVSIANGHVIWYGGEWLGGEWLGGTWYRGCWHAGTWHAGEWHAGTWRTGEWRNGHWHNGDWHNGIWRGGNWFCGDWLAGEWRGGVWYAGTWHNGTWRSGEWRSGDWRGGYWLGGEWGRRDGGWRGASVSWPEHGESGRTLRTLMHADGRVQHSCGCFSGSDLDLLDYIDEGEPTLRSSRMRARRINLALLDGRHIEIEE